MKYYYLFQRLVYCPDCGFCIIKGTDNKNMYHYINANGADSNNNATMEMNGKIYQNASLSVILVSSSIRTVTDSAIGKKEISEAYVLSLVFQLLELKQHLSTYMIPCLTATFPSHENI